MAEQQDKKEGGSLALIAVLGLAGALIPTLVIMLLVRTCEEPTRHKNYKYEREKLAKRKAGPEDAIVVEKVEEVVVDTVEAKEDVFLTLEEGLLALAPGIYVSVRFLLEDGRALTPSELEKSEGVHTIEITVKAEKWDTLKPQQRVDLLNITFKFIKDRFPTMTKILRLAYDDARPSFDMKFGSEI